MSATTSFDPGLPQLRRFGDTLTLAACAMGAALSVLLGWHYAQWQLALVGAGTIMAAACAAYGLFRGSWLNSVVLPVLLMSVVALNIQLGGGRSEYHFGVFTSIAFLLAYRHWLPILSGAAAIAVHHILFDRLQAWGFPVFCQSAPDFIGVLHHASYVVAEAGIGIMMAHSMRRDAMLSLELECVTDGLTRHAGKIDFSQLDIPARSASGMRLLSILKDIRGSVHVAREAVDSVNTASAEIAGGNQDLSQRTEKNAADLQRTASAVEQLTAALGSASEATQQAAKMATIAAQRANDGEQAAERLSTSMERVSDTSRKVSDITGLIDSIAFQTNILALNAAVEAARAGEHGRGFAVVASEVRQLAQRSAKAAGEIKSLIATSTQQVDEGVAVAQQTRTALCEVIQEVQRVNGMLAEVATSAQEQSRGISDVNHAVGELETATQQNAALVEQSASAAESLKAQAAQLARAMDSFELDIAAA